MMKLFGWLVAVFALLLGMSSPAFAGAANPTVVPGTGPGPVAKFSLAWGSDKCPCPDAEAVKKKVTGTATVLSIYYPAAGEAGWGVTGASEWGTGKNPTLTTKAAAAALQACTPTMLSTGRPAPTNWVVQVRNGVPVRIFRDGKRDLVFDRECRPDDAPTLGEADNDD